MTPYPLDRTESGTKILITLFLLFMVGSFAVALLNVYDKIGRVQNGVAERYGPDRADPPAYVTEGAGTATGGIYDEGTISDDQAPVAVAKVNTFSALIDITHPHVFEMPLIILVLCHFLMRTRLANWAKILTYTFSFGGVAGMLMTPWLVRYVSVGFAPLMMVSAVSLGLSAFPLIFVPLWSMWAPRKQPKSSVRTAVARVSEQFASQ